MPASHGGFPCINAPSQAIIDFVVTGARIPRIEEARNPIIVRAATLSSTQCLLMNFCANDAWTNDDKARVGRFGVEELAHFYQKYLGCAVRGIHWSGAIRSRTGKKHDARPP